MPQKWLERKPQQQNVESWKVKGLKVHGLADLREIKYKLTVWKVN